MDENIQLVCTANRLRAVRKGDPLRAAELERRGELRARIITTKFDNAEVGAPIANLRKECQAADIRRLYRKQWAVETKYHPLKNKIKFERVTGKASIYGEQDFWAQVLVFNVVQDLLSRVEEKLKRQVKREGYRYGMRINENRVIGLFKERLVRIIMEGDHVEQGRMFRQMGAKMVRNIVPIRASPGRPRRWHYCNKYNLNPTFWALRL